MDRFDSMAVFVATVDKGSLSAAAEAFGISAPMAGKHIRQLEERLGARLLTRTTRRHSLTEIGRAYLDSAASSLSRCAPPSHARRHCAAPHAATCASMRR
jgi:DNA-binding transcriptional LysR family regulator